MAIDSKVREQSILDAAASLIIHHGYDKTTMGDVADAVGLNRALIYAHFKSKDDLLEALIRREMRKYGQLWIEHLLADTKGGTIASIHRSIAFALKNTPFMAAIVSRDEGTFGKYLHKPGNIFKGVQTPSLTHELMQALQDAGAVRQGINIPAMAYIMDVLSYALVERQSPDGSGALPPYDELLETMADMFDRMMTPEDGGNLEAGKQVIRRLAETARAHFEQMEESKEGQQ